MKPLLVFDGDCRFCRHWAARWQAMAGPGIECAPYQEVAERFPGIAREEFARAVRFIEPDGTVTSGAHAAFRCLAASPSWRWLHWAYRHAPGFGPAAEGVYRFIARRRGVFSRLTGWLWGSQGPLRGADRYHASSWLFVRGLALVYAAAFLSLAPQIAALVGDRGIAPAGDMLAAWKEVGPSALVEAPTLGWLALSDGLLKAACLAGAAASAALFLGVFPGPVAFLIWILYLSLATLGGVFLRFQWDALLLETGFLALFLVRWRGPFVSWRARGLPPAAHGLARLLIFKLMFSSGVVKLSSGDEAWWGLHALDFHYETQPLPTVIGWWAHQLPAAFQRVSVLGMFVVELVLPFFIFLPRRLRHLAAGAFVTLQVLIMATGNYGFFNLISIVLVLLLVDDAAWRSLARRPLPAPAVPALPRPWRVRRLLAAPFLVLFVLLHLVQIGASLRRPMPWIGPLRPALAALAPFHVCNGYGLFSVMTDRRREIIVEGSRDGRTWQAYPFRYKPGPVDAAPRWTGPHMPRLDWQMWFAALGPPGASPWFGAFAAALLEGRGPVLALLPSNPFPGEPPRYLRARLYDYRFTTSAEREATGHWWEREPLGLYLPPVTRRSETP